MRKVVSSALAFLPGIALIVALAIGGKLLSNWLQAVIAVAWIRSLASNVIIAIIGGMLIGNFIRLPGFFAKGINSYEFFLKVGIVLMGTRFLITDVARLGGIGLAIVVVEILFSIAFVSLFARLFRLPEKLGSLISVGVGICGVSAIIGAAGSIEPKKEETGYAIAVILVFGALALIAYPLLGRLMGMSDKAFGIWAGLAVDNTAEAVATGAIYSKAALAYTTLAKLCRNALMGFVILGFAIYYSRRGLAQEVTRKGLFLWQKFPKFVLGFLVLSVLFSILFAALRSAEARSYLASRTTALKGLSEWAFQLTFVGVGLRTSFRDMARTGLSPLVVGVVAETAVAALHSRDGVPRGRGVADALIQRVHGAPQFLGGFPGPRVDGRGVNAEGPRLHDDLPVHDHGVDVTAAHAEYHVPGNVVPHQRRGRIVVQDDEVRLVSLLHPAEALPERPVQDLVSVLKEPGKGPGGKRASGVPVAEVRELHLQEHVGADAVRSQRDVLHVRKLPVVAHVVVHVGPAIVGKKGAARVQHFPVLRRQVQAVGDDRLVGDKAELVQPLQGVLSVEMMRIR